MSLHQHTAVQLAKMLRNLSVWLEKAAAYAESRGFDPDVLAASRLAPDQYPLTRQVQSACDSAKFAVARLTGTKAPVHEDTETTIAQLIERIAATVAFIEHAPPEAFEGADGRMIMLPFLPGKAMRGADYLVEMALPNFYFHVTTAYAIMRHNGVPLGKTDFIGGLTLRDG